MTIFSKTIILKITELDVLKKLKRIYVLELVKKKFNKKKGRSIALFYFLYKMNDVHFLKEKNYV